MEVLASPMTGVRGRECEIAVADDHLSAARSGVGGVLLLEGPPGIGKSALAGEIVARARRAGMRVLRAESAGPLGPLLAAVLEADPPIADPHDFRAEIGFWMVHDLGVALAEAAARTPLVIVLDGLEADPETCEAVRVLAARLRDRGILWLLVRRPGLAAPVPEAEVLRLGPLPAEARTVLVGDLARATPAPALLALAAAAGGHPSWIADLVGGLDEEGRLTFEDGTATPIGDRLPRRVTAALAERLRALSPAARQAVRVAAALPVRFTAAHLAGLLRVGPTDLVEPLDEAVRAGLLTVDGGDLRFRVALLRQAGREALPDSLRRALEREAADVLLRSGAEPAEVAALLADTAEVGDHAAIETLRASARAIHDPVTAAGLLVRALDLLGPGDADLGVVTLEALSHLRRAGREEQARTLAARALAAMLPPPEEAGVRLALSTMIDRPAGERAAENRSALALRGVASPVRSCHAAWLAYNLLEGGEHGEAERVARAAVATPDAGDVARLVLAGVHASRGAGNLASAALDRLVSTADPDDPYAGPRDLLVAVLLHHLGRTDDAVPALTECLRRARLDRDTPLLALGTQLSAMVHLVGGRLAEARGQVSTIDEPAGLAGVLRMITLARLAQHLGDSALSRAATTAARRLRTGDSAAGSRWAERVLALTAAARGDARHAARLLRDDPLIPAAPPLPADFTFLAMAARVALAAGDKPLRERLLDAAATLESGAADAPAFAAAAVHVHGLLTRDTEELLTAAKLQTAAGRPLLAAGAFEDAAATEAHDDAVGWLEQALAGFSEAGATADVRRVRRSLREHGAGRSGPAGRSDGGWESLTDAELKVVHLIAAGATNRSAAQQLYLSPHTVNTHVRNVFTKLGISSRVQLAHVLRDHC
ncbi:helix-turn-helix transcriptional regulator [Actinoplanes solisilvae]|uniref:helix-turn-helix transcriptional regulator n=1 Tax=Actinoplanes solisilvae TaxID=2486853 RepID=UPI000FD7539F|nr:LuxR family transcriptional regulator [Actinoplanes solisilvae]